jgi:PTH1 family peptidyl-tRNA hydrolase
MTLVVGLGNPGTQYEKTRHNIGFRVIDKLVSNLQARNVSKTTFHGELYRHGNLLLLKPTTYMNLSGKSLLPVKQFFKVELENILVIHDDIDLPYGALRFKKGGGHGGHNGLKSLDATIGNAYLRIRMGVDKPQHKTAVADYVLSNFKEEEEQTINKFIDHTMEATQALFTEELTSVKSRYSLKSIESLKEEQKGE